MLDLPSFVINPHLRRHMLWWRHTCGSIPGLLALFSASPEATASVFLRADEYEGGELPLLRFCHC